MSDEKLIHLCQTCIDFNNRVSGANSCAECWDKMKEKELGISDEEKVQILIKMDKKAYECIKNLDNLEEKEGIFPAIEAFNAFVEAVQDGEYVHYEEEKSVLDKIKDEIEQLTITKGGDDYVRKMAELFSFKMKVLQIIDKYRAESEE